VTSILRTISSKNPIQSILTARTYEKRSVPLAKIAFPSPIEYSGGQGSPCQKTLYTPNKAHTALFSQSTKKSPGPVRLGVSVIRLTWSCGPDQLTSLTRIAAQLEKHPKNWKVAKRIVIQMPGKIK
jgi:hypothetical protein